MSTYRESLKDRKRIVVKIGSSSLMHPETGKLDLVKIEKLIRILCDIRNSGKDVVLVSSGAIAVGRMAIGLNERPDELPVKQACAAIGQARLMMVYQKIFAEYSQITAQVLMTKYSIINGVSRQNAENTFKELLSLGVIPVVNENDTVSTDEIQHVQTFGDNDRLSAIVSYLIGADLLLEFVVRFRLGQTAEYQIDLSQLHTAEFERFDGVFECRSLGVGNDCGNFGIVLTDAFFKSRHVVLGFYLFERRNPERSAELAKQRILFLIARDHHKTS